jgi:hypothetical protein
MLLESGSTGGQKETDGKLFRKRASPKVKATKTMVKRYVPPNCRSSDSRELISGINPFNMVGKLLNQAEVFRTKKVGSPVCPQLLASNGRLLRTLAHDSSTAEAECRIRVN